MPRTTYALFFAFLFLSFAANAQSKKNLKDSASVIIFNQSSNTSTAKKHRSSESNIIKIAPLGLLSGTFPILYERRITDFFSIQAAGGITLKNYTRSAFAKEAEISYTYPWNNTSYYDEASPIYDFQYRKPKMGFMASVQPRVYFASEGLDGSFLGLSFDYYKYKFEIPALKGTSGNYSHTGAMQSEFENIKDYMVHFGYQSLYDRISLEYSTAIGMRNVTGSKYAATTYGGSLQEGFATYKQSILNFNFGIKVGYHF